MKSSNRENNRGNAVTVTRLSGSKFSVEIVGASEPEVWDIEEPEQVLLFGNGCLVYVNPQGEIEDVIGAAALVRVRAMP